jgi:NADH dehydrogenase
MRRNAFGAKGLAARTVIWAAGVQASPLARTLGVSLDPAGRVPVTPQLTLAGHDEVFVIGDLASIEQDGKRVPGVSPAAIQQGIHTAANIRRAVHGEPLVPFRYWDKGSFATLGRGAAVGDLFGKVWLSGFPAWLAWLLIHIYFLIGFRNRLLVMFQWAYSYLTYRRGARLITGDRGAPSPPAGTSVVA